ncbi:MAG TPA: FMN-binding negative transcriptional regulator [Kofleriaceae bacterium]|nr:FMN-binding negative transcriptional regulator [Kofleriaceae bacterium]
MYLPGHFEEREPARLTAIVDAHPLAVVVAVDERGAPEISHLPCLRDEEAPGPLDRVLLHVARGNRLAELAERGARMTAVFSGPHCYVSARLFRDPSRQVPSWNYAVVHASGRSTVLTAEATRGLLARMAVRFERGEDPWHPDATEPGFVDKLIPAIVGIAIEVDRVEGKFKLNQNRSAEDREDVRRGLAAGDEHERAVAALMS